MTTYTTSGLTTAFTPAPSCYSRGLTGTAGAYSFGERTTTVNYDNVDECYPWKTSLYYSYGTFSPGMCPGGYTTALSTSASGMVNAACCPSNYDKLSDDAYCTSTRTTSMSIDCVFPSQDSNSATCSPDLIGPGHAVQFAVHVMYASSDLTRFPTGYTPGRIGDKGAVTAAAFTEHVPGATGSGPASSTTGNIPGTSGPTSSAGSHNDGGGSLSSGAKAGIGVGVAIVALALLGGLLFILRRRGKRTSVEESGGSVAHENSGHHDDKEVVAAGYAPYPVEKHYHSELDGQASPINELAGAQEQKAQELPYETTKNPPTHNVPPAPVAGKIERQSTPAHSDMTATALGPVSTQLDHLQHDSTMKYQLPPDKSTGSAVDQAAPSQVTVEDVELKYLEEEEKRIRERKEAILATRRAQ